MVRSKGLEPSRLLGTTTSRLRVYQFHHERIAAIKSTAYALSALHRKRFANRSLTITDEVEPNATSTGIYCQILREV